jgi:GT2 family glycosyltransferase
VHVHSGRPRARLGRPPSRAQGPRAGPVAASRRKALRGDVSAIVVTYDALPWIERCLESVRGLETIIVDHGSTDGTLALVRKGFPAATLIEQENRGLAAGWNAGMDVASGRYFLILNADAWVLDDAVERLAAFADTHPDAAVVAPRLRYPDGRLQRSVRGFPTLWRIATEYFFLRKLAPRSRALNAFYADGFDHNAVRQVDWVMGACLLVRRAAVEKVGPLDDGYFLFSEETDWCYRFRQGGWATYFLPEAEVAHVLGAAHGGRLFREQVRGHLRFLAKHHGPRQAERARRMMLVALRFRSLVFPGNRGQTYRQAADWLGSASAQELLESR